MNRKRHISAKGYIDFWAKAEYEPKRWTRNLPPPAIHRKIVVFKTDGTVAFVIDRFGHGEGEYQDFGCFTVDEDYIYVIDNTRRAILFYKTVNL